MFSDKTGTLTSNEMQLRMIAIKGVPYGTLDFRSALLFGHKVEAESSSAEPAPCVFDLHSQGSGERSNVALVEAGAHSING